MRAEDLKAGMTLPDGRVIRRVGLVGSYWSITMDDDSTIGIRKRGRTLYRLHVESGELRKEAE